MSVMQWNEQAKQAIDNGFNLIPLRHGDKRALRSGKWKEQLLSSEEVDKLPLCGFGLVCGVGEQPIYAFDVDSKDKKTADTFKDAFEVLHGKPLVRVGQKPKILIPFRMSNAGIKKKQTPKSQQGHLDILGGGQYFVAYNIHPQTKEEYTWTTPPHSFKAEELPLLSEEDVEHLFDFFKESTTPVVRAKKEITPVVKGKNNNNRRYTNREITAFLSCFGEEFTNGSHDEWIPIVMAIHHETRGSTDGKELARRWSKRGTTYDEENFNYKWGTFVLPEELSEDEQKKKKCSTFASLLYHHRKLIPDGLLCDRFTDAYSTALFSICNRGNYLYVESLGGWFVRKKHLWFLMCESKEKISGAVHRFLVECREDRNDLEDWSVEKKEQARKEAKSKGVPVAKSPRDTFYASFKSEKVEGTAKAKSITTLLEASGSFFIDPDRVGCDKRYIGDGYDIVDLETGKRIDYSPKLIIIKTTKTPFVDGEPSKEFFDFVSQYFENQELMNFFARCVGMALYGRNEAQVLVNLLGDGGTGKSTLTNLIELAFGSQYVSHLPFKDLASPYEGDSDTPSPSIINAFGSRIALVSETNANTPLNEAVVKAITGGDTLATRRLHSNEIIRKKASFTPFVTTNKKLFIRGMDNGIWRRMLTIPLNKKIEQYDRTFADRLAQYASDAKRWFLQGVRDYIQRGHELDIPKECVDAVEENRSGLDTYQPWIDDYCEVGDGFCEITSVLTDSYNNYLRDEEKSRHSVQSQTLSRNLKVKGFEPTRKPIKIDNQWKTKRVILGLKLKPAFEAIEDENTNVIDFKK